RLALSIVGPPHDRAIGRAVWPQDEQPYVAAVRSKHTSWRLSAVRRISPFGTRHAQEPKDESELKAVPTTKANQQRAHRICRTRRQKGERAMNAFQRMLNALRSMFGGSFAHTEPPMPIFPDRAIQPESLA